MSNDAAEAVQTVGAFALTDFDLPQTSEAEPFWQGTAEGEVRVQRCVDCDARRFPARVGCPACGSLEDDWVAARGTPTLYSWVVVERATIPSIEVPYGVCMVEYAEDMVRLYGTLVGDPAGFKAGVALDVTTAPSAGVHIPVFSVRQAAAS